MEVYLGFSILQIKHPTYEPLECFKRTGSVDSFIPLNLFWTAIDAKNIITRLSSGFEVFLLHN